MGQILDVMCYQPQESKGELLFEFAIAGNVEGVEALCRMKGCAILEWTNGEGKTPLIAACTSPQGFEVAIALIKLGANVNAYNSGPEGGTVLHYAAKEGLAETVELLLSHGAMASIRNYDGHTPLDVAEMLGFTNVVHMFESEEDVELALALSSSVEDHTQNSAPATAPQSDIGDNCTESSEEDVDLAMALSYSIEAAEEADLRNALDASVKSAFKARSSARMERWGVPKYGRPRNVVAATPSADPSTSLSSSASCIICYEAPIEGVCSPCGHMAACMTCLARIEADKNECPVCRGKIDKVIKVFGPG